MMSVLSEPVYMWVDDQTGVMCRFFSGSCESITDEAGERVFGLRRVFLPPEVMVAEHDYRLTTATPGFSSVWRIVNVGTKYAAGQLDHYELDIITEPGDQ